MFTIHFGLGVIAGICGAVVVYPIDAVKTRVQAQKSLKSGTGQLYTGYYDCLRKILKQSGVRGLYAGLGAVCVGVGPEKAIKLTANDFCREKFQDENGEITLPMQFLSGGIAGFFQTIVTNPLEIVKIRMQLDPTASISRTIGELGFFGLYKGVASCMVRDVCFSSLYFPAYAGLKKAAANANGEVSVISTLTCGFLAGFPAAFFSTPADVIKTRLQEKGSSYTGIPNAAVTIVRNEGFNAIWKGAGARCLRSPPQFAVTLLVYEILNRFVNEKPTAAPTYMNAEKHLRHPDDNGGLKFTHNHLTTKVEDKFGLKLPKFELSPSVLL